MTAQRRPSRATRRRSIPAARSYSISCSQIAQTSASNGSGRAADPQPRIGPDRGADQRIKAEALVERPQVLVDPEGGAHPLDPPFGDLAAIGLGAEQHPVGAKLSHPDHHRLVAAVQQPVQDPAADPGDPI